MVQNPSCKNSTTTESHWNTRIHTHICMHTLPSMFQHSVRMNSLPSIRINRRQSGCTTCWARRQKCFLGHDKDWEEPKQEQLSPRPLSVQIHAQPLSFYPPTWTMVRSARVPQTSCVSAPLIPSTSCLSHPETEGLGGLTSAKVCPAQNLQTCVL